MKKSKTAKSMASDNGASDLPADLPADLPSALPSSSTVEEPVGPKEGYIVDYVSGRHVKDSPEEREAVQVFSRMLVEDYGYPLSHIQTRPQFRVKARPSDTKKEYPVDIAVFTGKEKQDDQVYIVVECKKKDRKDGLTQLQDYLRFCDATLGVWFNGAESLYLKKIEKSGKVYFEQIPNIPLFGQRVEDVGLFHRKDLRSATNLKSIFKVIRNYLAANAVGITRDEVFAQQLINLIFCKIYDEKYTKPEQVVSFRAGVGEDPADVSTRIKDLFEHVKNAIRT
ncbi:type I restriction enzyme HsdR N-terminal domain-containing protein [Paraburkholderia sp. SARCC-3016]|uniref:type I restriction enzyme HsdR N-terminal domain-containing protein n=1 Tax=Paraburkholderia sp. SARCC-3016 TaxID=3058611 RepID=UPI00280878ED|nr:type I restriction enzyme HsdR N-terminal domain-containing protein [Paraburkholderia sp. SARCC-3016]MDQ7979137.1 type I restriction enzyme HsdR N-terminal domain-containing protein [Paraburkholderia sp. SARCC-3016]